MSHPLLVKPSLRNRESSYTYHYRELAASVKAAVIAAGQLDEALARAAKELTHLDAILPGQRHECPRLIKALGALNPPGTRASDIILTQPSQPPTGGHGPGHQARAVAQARLATVVQASRLHGASP